MPDSQRRILDVAESEQARIGQELHDGLGQHLTGVAFLAKALARKLGDKGVPEAVEAEKLVQLINRSVSMTRSLAHGLRPVGNEDNALMVALRQLALDVTDLYHLDCRFVADELVLVRSPCVAHHLFRIAQEAVNNAIKHGFPSLIVIELERKVARRKTPVIVLRVSNDGAPIARDAESSGGMGLAGMKYRATLVGAQLALRKERRPMVAVTVTVDETTAHEFVEPREDLGEEHG
ncbi:MAG TPA: histidine kinase [Burkholderiaceae bacterium]|nr:histidine kinase [Burkholderiaceae bacterium]